MSGRRATKSTTSEPSARRPTRPRPRVVGEQPLPALHVAGEAEDELGRGRRRRCAIVLLTAACVRANARPTANRRQLDEPGSAAGSSSGVNQAHVSVEPSTSSRSSPPVIRTR